MPKMSYPLKYPGGKSYWVKWVNGVMRTHHGYLDVTLGGGSTLWSKTRSPIEIGNDINPYLINFYRQIQAGTIIPRVLEIEYSEDNFNWSKDYRSESDPEVAAIKYLVCNRMSFDSKGKDYGWSDRLRRKRPENVSAWQSVQRDLPKFFDRIQGVSFLNLDAITLINRYKYTPDFVIYIDYPYLLDENSKRKSKNLYEYEVTRADHIAMLEAVQDSSAQIMISHYEDSLYDEYLNGWNKHLKPVTIKMGGTNKNDRKGVRVEAIWSNR